MLSLIPVRRSTYRNLLSYSHNANYNLKLKSFSGDAANDHNVKKFKLVKRLASTLLFGGTFLTVVWAKKRKHSSIFEDAKLVKNTLYNNNNFQLYEYRGYILPSFVLKNLNDIQNFSCRESDIFVVSFPKTVCLFVLPWMGVLSQLSAFAAIHPDIDPLSSALAKPCNTITNHSHLLKISLLKSFENFLQIGTTWLQEIIYCTLKSIDSSLTCSLEDRFPYLEYFYPGLSFIEKMTDQRLIKTHLPYSLLPKDVQLKKPKIFYIARNPKDVAVSYYHFVRMMTISNYSGSFRDFFEDFLLNKVPYGPIWRHYQEIWELRNEPNVFILSYEDLHLDTRGSIKRIAEFLGKDLTDSEIDAIAEHCSFKNMSQNPNVNYQYWDDLGIRNKDEAKFMRKGQIGDWKNYFTLEMNQAMSSWIDENMKDMHIFHNDGKKKICTD